MKACLISAREDPGGEVVRSCRRRAAVLAERHEVTVVYPREVAEEIGSPSGSAFRELVAGEESDLDRIAFAGEDHRYSALAFETLARVYDSAAVDYVEACDRGAPGLVSLQARRGGHPALRGARFAVRLVGGGELRALHDRALSAPGARVLRDLEREQLRLADRLIWPGGDGLGLYRRHYPFELPEATRVAEPFPLPQSPPQPEPRDPSEPLRVLYAGGFRRHQGALDIAAACLRLPAEEWQLTMVGEDTPTAPAGLSVQMTVEAMLGDDPRLKIGVWPEDGLQPLLARHDLLVVPPRIAVWPEVALEAMRAGVPVLATPVGGLTELVEDGVGGRLAAGAGADALGAALRGLLERREDLQRMRASAAGFERLRCLADPGAVAEDYERLLREALPPRSPPRPAVRREGPLVSGIVPYFRASAYVEEAVGSLLGQTHRNVEAIVVNDGSFEEADGVLGRLAQNPRVRVVTKLNGGDGSARNLGALVARGEYLAMVDADNAIEPQFVERALDVFGRQPELAYVSCWLRFVNPDGSPHTVPAGYAPLGNSVLRDDEENWDADALALMPRRLFAEDDYRYEEWSVTTSDWELYRRLREDGRFGAVIPERLGRYRVVPGSVLQTFDRQAQRRAWGEALDRRHGRRPAGYRGEAAG